ncbi:hypothetical protein [Fodinicurvata fenggangensis]|uniref:hypothetical protein n=1 Tax=Fodinicurvata fenggangensis TaxID=1121830 RepID=UPI000478DC9F|nr:hypothetical protein [Fodinicurvata fenggangensis]
MNIRETVVGNVVANVRQHIERSGSVPEQIALLRYSVQSDLDDYWPEMAGLPLSEHEAALLEIKERIEGEWDMSVAIVNFDHEHYVYWLDGAADSQDMRVQYAAEHADE